LEKTVAGLLDQLDDQSPFKGSGGGTSAGTAGNQRTLGQDTLEAELAETKKKLKDLERGHEREKTALNSEVAQLESLVEAKIFREDELEQQLADARKALADLKSRTGGASGAVFERHQRATKSTIRATESNGRRSASAHSDTDDDDGKCELCGDPHGIEVSRQCFP
jgi:DNA repair exonuclease SbcCD ATPase subunit